ncbi:TetR-like C-terminal domain-containing protein [Streptomyces sp. NPDC086077]|uniref:TetR-like C-terminal domain-containing protein n=1 Tax=Streptomyces sp. NPDC086077 TaxID=3154862 RepID=UPI00342429A8
MLVDLAGQCVVADQAVFSRREQARADRCNPYAYEQGDLVLSRASQRGEPVPAVDVVIDHVVAPMMYRILFRPGMLDPDHARTLVDTTLTELTPQSSQAVRAAAKGRLRS